MGFRDIFPIPRDTELGYDAEAAKRKVLWRDKDYNARDSLRQRKMLGRRKMRELAEQEGDIGIWQRLVDPSK